MEKNQNWVVLLVALILLINGVFIKALADDDDHEEKKWLTCYLLNQLKSTKVLKPMSLSAS